MAWFGRKPQAAKPDVLTLLDEHARRGDVTALIQACNTLSGLGSVLFGMPLHAISNPDALKEPARRALEVALAHVPLDQADTVLALATRAAVPIDVAPLRARLAAAAEPARARIEAALAGMTDVALLIAAYETLSSGGQVAGVYYGRSWPHRTTLLDVARVRLVDTIADLPPARARAAIIEIRRAGLDIPLDGVSAAVSHVDSDEPVDAAIEATIDANPDDPDSFAVLGDWLAERGHIRGELIALQLRGETDPALADAASAYISAHATELLGVLADLRGTHAVWRRGFIDKITLVAHDEILLHEQVAALLDHPSARRLRTLALVSGGYDESLPVDDAIRVIAHRNPRELRHLVLGDDQRTQLQDVQLTPIWLSLPNLHSLIVRGRFHAAPIHHERLARLQIETVALSHAEATEIVSAALPALAHLDVWFGSQEEEYDDDDGSTPASLADATALLRRTDLPHLTHLGLQNAAFTDELCAVLAVPTQLARQLVELDLSLGTMSQAGADALIAAARNLPRLERLCVTENYLDVPTLERLRQTFTLVISADQREDHGDRYPAVME